MQIESARMEDLPEIFEMYKKAIAQMENQGIFQWDEIYPDEETIKQDIGQGQMYVAKLQREIAGAYVLNTEYDEQYKNGRWNSPEESFVVVHRLCVHPGFQHRGLARRMMLAIENEVQNRGAYSIRLDAYTKNPAALRLYGSLGYETTGYANWRKGRFCLMEKVLA